MFRFNEPNHVWIFSFSKLSGFFVKNFVNRQGKRPNIMTASKSWRSKLRIKRNSCPDWKGCFFCLRKSCFAYSFLRKDQKSWFKREVVMQPCNHLHDTTNSELDKPSRISALSFSCNSIQPNTQFGWHLHCPPVTRQILAAISIRLAL